MLAKTPCASSTLDPMVRAAWLYYVEGLTQANIARVMNVSRARVIALLAQARDQAVVRVRIEARGSGQVALERALVARYGLGEAVVVPAPAREAAAALMVGHATGSYLTDQLRDGMSIGVGWGETLYLALKSIGAQRYDRLSVVSLLGGVTHSQAMTPPTVARRMADTFGAECFQLTAPLIVSDATVRASLWAEPGLRDLRERARRVDLALVSVGDVSETATLFRGDLVPGAELAGLRAAGAVGDVLCHFIDAQGRVVDHPINRRTMAVDLGDLAGLRRVVVASGGRRKVAALRAALRALPVSALITDERAAQGLLDG